MSNVLKSSCWAASTSPSRATAIAREQTRQACMGPLNCSPSASPPQVAHEQRVEVVLLGRLLMLWRWWRRPLLHLLLQLLKVLLLLLEMLLLQLLLQLASVARRERYALAGRRTSLAEPSASASVALAE